MAKYGVELPIAGFIYLEVEADSEDDAIQVALDTEWRDEDIQELYAYEKLVEGNICYVCAEASTRKLGED